MPLYRDPGTPGRDAHFLVVVTIASAGGEGIAHPETVFRGQTIGDVREGCRTLVSRHNQVMVVVVMTDHPFRRRNAGIHQIVGDIQQPPDKCLIGFDALGLESLPVRRIRQALGHKATFGADRHDNRILDLLGLDQPQNLGAVILKPV